MKRFVILGAMMLVSNVSLVCAMHNYDGKEGDNTSSTDTTDDYKEREIDLEIIEFNPPTVMSIIQPTVRAYIQGKVIIVEAQNVLGEIHIVVTEVSSGMPIYRMNNGSVLTEIPLDACFSGQYQIDIRLSNMWLQGQFAL